MNGQQDPLTHYAQTPRQHPWGLRPTLLFPLPAYPLAIFANLFLRLTWSLKLSAHLHAQVSGALLFFWLEIAELLRRWVWVFFRVEWECVKRELERERGERLPLHQHDGVSEGEDYDYEDLGVGMGSSMEMDRMSNSLYNDARDKIRHEEGFP